MLLAVRTAHASYVCESDPPSGTPRGRQPPYP